MATHYSKYKDLTGQRFIRLTVVQETRTTYGKYTWQCLCDCGKSVYATSYALCNGRVKSCGCLKRYKAKMRHLTHGMTDSSEHKIWIQIRQRCNNKNSPAYYNYGGRGITVDPRWDDFAAFIADVGLRPSVSHSIERRDNSQGYSPENCYWATRTEQNNNNRRNRLLSFNGQTQNISQWAKQLGISHSVIRSRIKKEWSTERALTQPVKK